MSEVWHSGSSVWLSCWWHIGRTRIRTQLQRIWVNVELAAQPQFSCSLGVCVSFFERNVSFQRAPVIRYSAGDSTEAAAGTVCLCVITCASQCCSRFHLWFAPTPALSLSLNVALSPLCLFCLSRSKMVCQVKGHLFVVLIMNEQFPLRGRMVRTLRLQQVCVDAYLCVCVWASQK